MQKGFEHFGDLVGQVPRGDEDQSSSSHNLGVRLQFVDDGEEVGQRLARPRLVAHYHVLPLHHQRNRLLLNRGWVLEFVNHDVEKEFGEEGILCEPVLVGLLGGCDLISLFPLFGVLLLEGGLEQFGLLMFAHQLL